MMRTLTWALLSLSIAGAFVLYSYKYDTRRLEARVLGLERLIERREIDIAVLKAEISHLSAPERIEKLARDTLNMQPLDAGQFGAIGEVPLRGQVPSVERSSAPQPATQSMSAFEADREAATSIASGGGGVTDGAIGAPEVNHSASAGQQFDGRHATTPLGLAEPAQVGPQSNFVANLATPPALAPAASIDRSAKPNAAVTQAAAPPPYAGAPENLQDAGPKSGPADDWPLPWARDRRGGY